MQPPHRFVAELALRNQPIEHCAPLARSRLRGVVFLGRRHIRRSNQSLRHRPVE
jgi:hypothetical protein